MSAQKKIDQAYQLLDAIGVPVEKQTARRRKRWCMALLGAANLKPRTPWKKAAIAGETDHNITTREMIEFWNRHYGEDLSRGSYDDVKRKDLDVLMVAGVVTGSAGNIDANPNDPTRGYAVTKEAADLLQTFGTNEWPAAVEEFKKIAGTLRDRFNKGRVRKSIVIKTPSGKSLKLNQGDHNILQKQIVELFLPQFVPDAVLLYVGDATNKSLFMDESKLEKLGFFELSHEMLPDVVAYSPKRNWIILIEAVHSANPIDHVRHLQMEESTKKCTAPCVYVSAFKDRASFRKWILEISWETEVWLAEEPEHLIHFNGDKFLGPYEAE
jgi:type II restriction enzyme